MNSGRKKTRPKEDPMFKIDPETGKFTLLPIKLPSGANSITKDKSTEKKSKRKIFIAPLKVTAADFEDGPNRGVKVRKIDNNSVRKELFNLPSRRSQIGRPSIQNRQSISRRSIPSKKIVPKKFNPCELSPLLDMEEVEEELINKKGFLGGYPFKTPSKPAINFAKNVKNSPFTKKAKLEKKKTPKKATPTKTPDSQSSNDNEFLELEKMCYTDNLDKENNCNQSPISSVCNLLEGTRLNSHKKLNRTARTDNETLITSIENVLEKNRIALDEYKTSHDESVKKIAELLEIDKKKYDNLIAFQEENTSNISKFLNKLKYSSADVSNQTDTPGKENSPISNRRSKRLFNKSPVQSNDAKLIVSPVRTRREDLRKSTLTKNLVTKSQQYQIQSPRLQKALNMYNSIRGEISILSTPKLDRQSLMESPKTTNLSRLLSRRVQSQCHLLQDTPLHK